MVAKKGRPVSDNPKDFMLRIRLDRDTLFQLDACCAATEKSRSELIRKWIQEQYYRLKK